ncbi:hypothetical protein PENTCL1PPCAC_4667, partial [Pristionchus entomophagus]
THSLLAERGHVNYNFYVNYSYATMTNNISSIYIHLKKILSARFGSLNTAANITKWGTFTLEMSEKHAMIDE